MSLHFQGCLSLQKKLSLKCELMHCYPESQELHKCMHSIQHYPTSNFGTNSQIIPGFILSLHHRSFNYAEIEKEDVSRAYYKNQQSEVKQMMGCDVIH